MLKLVMLFLISIVLTSNLWAGKISTCGTKINCKIGKNATCTMADGSIDLFYQYNKMDSTSSNSLFLSEIYAYKIGSLGTVDCYYFQDDDRERFIIFKTFPYHNVIPSDSHDWVQRWDTLYCDPAIYTCLLYALY